MIKKFVIPFALMISAVALVGAGCQSQEQVQNQEPAATTTVEQPQQDITLNVESTGTGTVKMQWTLPSDFSKDATVRLLHSSKPEPEFPGAYWYQRPAADASAVWSNIPAGTRYFRVCEFAGVGNKCLRYSNTVELEVK